MEFLEKPKKLCVGHLNILYILYIFHSWFMKRLLLIILHLYRNSCSRVFNDYREGLFLHKEVDTCLFLLCLNKSERLLKLTWRLNCKKLNPRLGKWLVKSLFLVHGAFLSVPPLLQRDWFVPVQRRERAQASGTRGVRVTLLCGDWAEHRSASHTGNLYILYHLSHSHRQV